jgi:hypothetical protein
LMKAVSTARLTVPCSIMALKISTCRRVSVETAPVCHLVEYQLIISMVLTKICFLCSGGSVRGGKSGSDLHSDQQSHVTCYWALLDGECWQALQLIGGRLMWQPENVSMGNGMPETSLFEEDLNSIF